jgi:DNA-binding NarL/FixJ family response regulator
MRRQSSGEILDSMSRLRCLVVDDSPRFAEAARVMLEHGEITIVGIASTAAEAIERAAELDPDVILVDIGLGTDSGFDVARTLGEADVSPAWRVVLTSTDAGEDFADLIAASPAVGFVPKSQLSGQAIRELLGEQRGRCIADRHGPG